MPSLLMRGLWGLACLRLASAFLLSSGSSDEAGALALDDDGNVFLLGSSKGPLCGQTHVGLRDGFVAKYDPDGLLQWMTQVGTSSRDQGMGLAWYDGVVYGLFYTTGEMEEGGSQGDADGAVLAWDAATGELQWTQQFGYATAEHPRSLVVTAEGVFALGYSDAASDEACFLFKFQHNGILSWDLPFGSADMNCLELAAREGDEGDEPMLYATGRVEEVAFNGVDPAGGRDAWVFAFDQEFGDMAWAYTFGTAEDDSLYSVLPLEDTDRLLAVGFSGTSGAAYRAIVAELYLNGTLAHMHEEADADLDVRFTTAAPAPAGEGWALIGGYYEGAEATFVASGCQGVRQGLLARWNYHNRTLAFRSSDCGVDARQVSALAVDAATDRVFLAGVNTPEGTTVVLDRQPLDTARNATLAGSAHGWPTDATFGATETLQFTTSSLPTINEGGGNAVVTVTRTRPEGVAQLCGALTATAYTNGVEASASSDFVGLSETLTFDEASGDSLTVTVTIVNDEDAERYNAAGDLINDGLETLYVRLKNVATTAQWAELGAPAQVLVTIFDTDVPSNTGDGGDVVSANSGSFAVVAVIVLVVILLSCAVVVQQSAFFRELKMAYRARAEIKEERKRAEKLAKNKELRFEHTKIKAQLKKIEGGIRRDEALFEQNAAKQEQPATVREDPEEDAGAAAQEEEKVADLEVGPLARVCDKCGSEVPQSRQTLVVCRTCGAVFNQSTGFSTFNRQMAEDSMGPFDLIPAEFRVAPEAIDLAISTIVRRNRDAQLTVDTLPHLVDMVLNHVAVMTYEDGSPLTPEGVNQTMQHILAQVIDELDKLGVVDESASPSHSQTLSRGQSLSMSLSRSQSQELRPPQGAGGRVAPLGASPRGGATAKVAPDFVLEDV